MAFGELFVSKQIIFVSLSSLFHTNFWWISSIHGWVDEGMKLIIHKIAIYELIYKSREKLKFAIQNERPTSKLFKKPLQKLNIKSIISGKWSDIDDISVNLLVISERAVNEQWEKFFSLNLIFYKRKIYSVLISVRCSLNETIFMF
jgi:hypothetical protein